jgi:hypothetical protein
LNTNATWTSFLGRLPNFESRRAWCLTDANFVCVQKHTLHDEGNKHITRYRAFLLPL